MSGQPQTADEKDRLAITDLISGNLSPYAAWKLRRRIARNPELAREYAEIATLFGDLKSLAIESPERVAPRWPADTSAKAPVLTVPFFGRLTMNRRTVFAATAALSLLCVTGGFAAVHYLYNPYTDMDAGNGLVWRADSTFRGEVKFYGADGTFHGSRSTYGIDGAPTTATVVVNGKSFPVSGSGRHELIDPDSNALLGSVELDPETKEDLDNATRQRLLRDHIEEPLSISHGDRDGFGKCSGFFGDEKDRITWTLLGSNVRVSFIDATTNKRVYGGEALEVNDTVRAEQRRTLSPESYAATVADSVPDEPVFTWQRTSTTNGSEPEHKMGGFGSYPLTLPDGMKVIAEVTRRSN